MKYVITLLLGFVLSGCTSYTFDSLTPEASAPEKTKTNLQREYQTPSAEKLEAYKATMKKVASGIKDDPNYNRISLDTAEKKAWFKDLTYRLWDRQITRDDFMAEGLKRYPSHKYEFQFIVDGFNS